MTLHLPADALARVMGHAKLAQPAEACGIIAGPAGQPTDGDATADRVIPIANTALDPAAGFVFGADGQLAAYADMDAHGEDPVVLYHSHPRGPAIPSQRDLAGAAGGTCLWLIVAMAAGEPVDVRVWRIRDGAAVEEPLRLVDGEREPRPAGASIH